LVITGGLTALAGREELGVKLLKLGNTKHSLLKLLSPHTVRC